MMLKLDWRRKRTIVVLGIISAVGVSAAGLRGQAVPPKSAHAPVTSEQAGRIEERLAKMAELLAATQQQLEQSRAQMDLLNAEIAAMRRQMGASEAATSSSIATVPQPDLTEMVARQGEELEVQQAEIHQHEQMKLETESKYGLKVYGLVLFNAFSNAGVVDNIDSPSIALARMDGMSHGSVGATVRQTVLGLRATGPTILNARTSADLSVDFFSNVAYASYGNSVANLRLRRADAGLDWKHDALHVGVDGPLISPLSPTSYASVGVPALGWAGNLWSWSTQVRYSHTQALGDRQSVELEAGLWDAPVVGSNMTVAEPIVSAGELSRRPGVELRTSYHLSSAAHPLVIGVGGYLGRESYGGTDHLNTWAVTADWQMPLTRAVSVTGEIYRGVGLGGFGGGEYKDLLTGIDPITKASTTIGLNAVGGWSQVKVKLPHTVEFNAAYGQDGGFAANLRRLDLSASTYYLEYSARNRMIFGNLIYRPKTYLIFSPEYRRIDSWQTTGPSRVANIFTLSAGYQF
jgi:hypothetical protein